MTGHPSGLPAGPLPLPLRGPAGAGGCRGRGRRPARLLPLSALLHAGEARRRRGRCSQALGLAVLQAWPASRLGRSLSRRPALAANQCCIAMHFALPAVRFHCLCVRLHKQSWSLEWHPSESTSSIPVCAVVRRQVRPLPQAARGLAGCSQAGRTQVSSAAQLCYGWPALGCSRHVIWLDEDRVCVQCTASHSAPHCA